MKKIAIMAATATLLTACGKMLSGDGGELVGARMASYNEPTPYGMVLKTRIIPNGTRRQRQFVGIRARNTRRLIRIILDG